MAYQAPGETPAFHNPSTRRLRLAALPTSEVPFHASLAATPNADAKHPSIVDFATEVLNETLDFTDTLMHSQFSNKGKPASSSPSTALVQVLTFDVMQEASGRNESWFGRRSIHEDAAKDGTASWSEFEASLFHEHSVNEGKYTPDIFVVHHVLSYGPIEGSDAQSLKERGWEDVAADIFEMGHRIPGPLNNRVFAVLVVRGKLRADKLPVDNVKDANGFVTAQIPVDLSQCPAAMFSNGKNRKDGSTTELRSKVVMGEYVSVERVRKQADGQVAWEMATASDAKGNIPMSVQKLGVPAAVLKDVGYVIKWLRDERRKVTPAAATA